MKEYDAMQQKMEQLYKEMIAKVQQEKRNLSDDAKSVIPSFYQGFFRTVDAVYSNGCRSDR